MKAGLLIFFCFGWFCSLWAEVVPYTGKLSVDGINFHGRAEFSFAIRDANGTVHWQHAEDNSSIRVNVVNGRYQVMLGGQGMESLPAELFLDRSRLFLVVSADLGDGRGRMPLKPDHRITSSAHALSADLARRALVAEQALTARGVESGAITGDMLSRALKQEMGDSDESVPFTSPEHYTTRSSSELCPGTGRSIQNSIL